MNLVIIDKCPNGCGELQETLITELPLLRHGGYGAARETIRQDCPTCGWGVVSSIGEVRP